MSTNEILAEHFEVSPRTIDNWIATIPEFNDAVRKGRQVADESVVSALFARATGMERKMTRVFCHNGQPVAASYTVELPPDVRACIFWLRNRRPQQWRENRPLVDEADEADRWRELGEACRRAGIRGPGEETDAAADCSEADAPADHRTAAPAPGRPPGPGWRSACGNCGNPCSLDACPSAALRAGARGPADYDAAR